MNEDIKTQWLAALRSGNYTQGRGKLRRVAGDRVSFCCLGVLCEVISPEKWEPEGSYNYWALSRTGLQPSRESQVGMTQANQDALIRMNDSGISFTDIAQYIEEYL